MKIVVQRSSLDPPRIWATLSGTAKGGGIELVNDFENRMVIGIGNTAYRSELKGRLDKSASPQLEDIAGWKLEAPGSLLVIEKHELSIDVAVDLLGCFPIFIRHTKEEVWLADQVSELVDGHEVLDPAAATEYLRFGFCVGSGTPFKQVERIRPGERVRIQFRDRKEHREDQSTLWTAQAEKSGMSALETFCEALKAATRSQGQARLMMSGGWDSRLLLAACLASGTPAHPSLYFHGDIESREAELVRGIQASENLHADFVEIVPRMFAPNELARHFSHFESVSFPFWHAVRDHSSGAISAVMAGIFGEVIGGHYGPPMVLSGRKKITESLAWLLVPRRADRQAGDTNGLARACEIYRQRPYGVPWYMRRDAWQDLFSSVHADIEERIHGSLARYRDRGIFTAHALIEAFITEHRGSQFIAAQLHSAANPGSFASPLANRSLIEFAAAIPFREKAFNRFSQAAIRHLQPRLLKFPMAATLCKAERPIVALEASRAVRKSYEAILAHRFAKRAGRTQTPPRLSWVNFHSIVTSGVLNEVIESLRSPYWSKPRLYDAIVNASPTRAHPLTDMILKIKTLDSLIAR